LPCLLLPLRIPPEMPHKRQSSKPFGNSRAEYPRLHVSLLFFLARCSYLIVDLHILPNTGLRKDLRAVMMLGMEGASIPTSTPLIWLLTSSLLGKSCQRCWFWTTKVRPYQCRVADNTQLCGVISTRDGVASWCSPLEELGYWNVESIFTGNIRSFSRT